MKRSKIVILFSLLFVGEFGYSQSDKPNIILVVADDVGYGDIQYYNPEGKIETPTLNMMAENGTALTDAHSSSSVCAPSRYSILTGNYPWRGERVNGTWDPFVGSQIKNDQVTLSKLLKNAGYRTGFYGKWNLGGSFFEQSSDETATSLTNADYERGYSSGPFEMGFDDSYYLLVGIQKPPYAFFRNENLVEKSEDLIYLTEDVNGLKLNEAGLGSPSWSTREAPRKILNELNNFIDQSEEPFFITYSMLESHWPWDPLDSLMSIPIKGETGISKRSDCVYQIDVSMKVIINTLKEQGKLENTIIIFTSDNGGNHNYAAELKSGHKINGDWYSGKGSIYEGGNRVPLIIYSGDNFKHIHDKISNSLVGLNDLYQTIAQLCTVEGSNIEGKDSRSFYDTVSPRSELLYQANLSQEEVSYHAIRENNLVLAFDNEYHIKELFDLAINKSQSPENNLIANSEYSNDIERLKCKFEAIRFEKNLKLSVDNNSSVKAFPNPFHNMVEVIGIEETFQYRVLSISGATLLTGVTVNSERSFIDLSSVNQKLVILEIMHSCKVKRIKLIREY